MLSIGQHPKVPIEDVAGAVKELIEAGKVRHVGMAKSARRTIRRAHSVSNPSRAIQSEYHLMWREPEQDVLRRYAAECGIGFCSCTARINTGGLVSVAATLNEYSSRLVDSQGTTNRDSPSALHAGKRCVVIFAGHRGLSER